MAIIVEGDPEMFAVMRYGLPTERLANYVQQEYQRAGELLSDVGRRMLDTTYQTFQNTLDSDVFRAAKAAMRRVGSLWGSEAIKSLGEIWQVQNANFQTARYVMAHTGLRTLYHQQSAEGYGNDYVDREPGSVGEYHGDWCRVMNGIATIDDDGWDATTYGWSTDTDEDELDESDQFAILETWETVDYAISEGIDPSSRYDHDL